jgi:hypothetical protein
VVWLRHNENPALLEAERERIAMLAVGRKGLREVLDQREGAIAEHENEIKRIRTESAEERTCSDMLELLIPIMTGESWHHGWWSDRIGSGPSCRSWFFSSEKDGAIIDAILGICDREADPKSLNPNTCSLIRRHITIVDRAAELVVPVTTTTTPTPITRMRRAPAQTAWGRWF